MIDTTKANDERQCEMTRDEIVSMAQEAALPAIMPFLSNAELQCLEHFAALVAAAERKECARVCQDVVESGMYDGRQQYAAAACRDEIRARSEKGTTA